MAGGIAAGGIVAGHAATTLAADLITLPFVNGQRRLAVFPEKKKMILLRTRPPLLETPFDVFNQGVFTPNDRFFVRWHLPVIPTSVDVNTFRLRIDGHVDNPVELTLKQILTEFTAVEMAAVNQCSGNGRGFFEPRVPGGEWGNGAMGNAMWTGVPLKAILDRAGIKAGAVAVRFRGLDSGEVPETPVFMKSLEVAHAMDGRVMVAYGMNGTQMPLLNGFPLRLVVPGWYSTYWVKMLTHIEVLDKPDDNFWMSKAYRIPDTPGAAMTPGQKGVKMIPINRMVPRSFITNLRDGQTVRANVQIGINGIAFGGDTGLREVALSMDGGRVWKSADLGKDYGPFSFRQWSTMIGPLKPGKASLMVRATNSDGVTQPMKSGWNPGGYMYNAIETVNVHAV
jgi:DMSO/TMAO reductase YedYZ molybdopterin-dependent catalytic subunit